MSAGQINSNDESEDNPEDAEEETAETTTEEVTKRRFDPETLASEGPKRADDDAIYVDDMNGDWFLDYAS